MSSHLENKICLDRSESKIIEPGIIVNTFEEGAMLEVDDLIATKQANLKLANGKRYCVLISFGYLTHTTKEARELAASKNFKNDTVAIAFLTHSIGQRLMGNFYLNINKPHVRSKLFNDEESALKWLREMLTENDVLKEWH